MLQDYCNLDGLLFRLEGNGVHCPKESSGYDAPPSQANVTIVNAQANLAELLRRSEMEEPQYIGAGKTSVVAPAAGSADQPEQRMPLGKWLVENMPRGANPPITDVRSSSRSIPFIDG